MLDTSEVEPRGYSYNAVEFGAGKFGQIVAAVTASGNSLETTQKVAKQTISRIMLKIYEEPADFANITG
jgi:hypothetical protein